MSRKPYQFLSPDGSTFIPASEEFTEGTVSWGIKLCDLLRAFRLAPAESGTRFFVCNEAELQTWSFVVEPDGTLSDPQLFVEEGGESVVVDENGRVFIAAGQVRVFDPSGQLVEIIEIPQRPTCLAIGGSEKRTLFITARSVLYGVQLH